MRQQRKKSDRCWLERGLWSPLLNVGKHYTANVGINYTSEIKAAPNMGLVSPDWTVSIFWGRYLMLALAVESVCAAPQQMGSTPVIEDQCESHIRKPQTTLSTLQLNACKCLTLLIHSTASVDVFQVRKKLDQAKSSGSHEWLVHPGLWLSFAVWGQTASSLIIRESLTTVQLSGGGDH